MKWLALAAAAVASLAVAAGAQAPTQVPVPVQAGEWRAAARGDVLAAFDSYVANHPGMHDPTNPGFAAQLGRARDRGLAYAERAQDRGGYAAALGAFSAELGDGHALAFANPPEGTQSPPQWPGFVAAWRGDRLFVHHAGPESPVAVGTVILGCDGMPAADFLRARLLTRGFRPAEAGHWWGRTPQAFVSTATLPGGPRSCLFRTADGREREVALSWTEAPADIDLLRRRASDGERSEIGLFEPRPGLFLVGLPDFNPDEAGIAAYRRLYERLAARRGELAGARAVLLDLRWNNGGSSAWSRDAAAILWGRPQVDAAMADFFRGVEIWWRASPGNIAHMSEMERSIRTAGREALADDIRTTGQGMAAAAARGEPFHRVPIDESASEGPAPRGDFAVPVYVITPGGCASACLDAVDLFTRFPNVRLVGAPTAGDSTYMEARSEPLPSGLGRLVIPTKIWMNRPRRSGEIYRPHIQVDDLDWSTETFLDAIERDLDRVQG